MFPTGGDPFADFFSKRRPSAQPDDSPSVLDDLKGTEVDPDPFGAFMARKQRYDADAAADTMGPIGRAIGKGMKFLDTPVFDESRRTLTDELASKGYGKTAAYIEGFGRQLSPLNIAMSALSVGRGAMALPKFYRAGSELAAAGAGEATRALASEALRVPDLAASGYIIGQSGAQAQEAGNRGDTAGVIQGIGGAALGALGAVAGMRPTRANVIGDILPPEVETLPAVRKPGPPDINIASPSMRLRGELGLPPGPDQRALPPYEPPEPLFPEGPRRPEPPPDSPAGEALDLPDTTRSDARQGAGSAGPAVPNDEIAAARRSLKGAGYPDALIDRVIESMIAGKTEVPGAERPLGQKIEPTGRTSEGLLDKLRAKREAAEAASSQPPASPIDEELANVVGAQPQPEAAPRTGHFKLPETNVPDDVYEALRDKLGIAPPPDAGNPASRRGAPASAEPPSDPVMREFAPVEPEQPRGLADRDVDEVLGTNQPAREPGSYEDFRSDELNEAGPGQPGLSTEDRRLGSERVITYRDPQGNPVATARLTKRPDGGWDVFSIAGDKTKGMLYGRAVKAVADAVAEHNPVEAVLGMSEDAQRLFARMRGKRVESAPEASNGSAPEGLQPADDRAERGPAPSGGLELPGGAPNRAVGSGPRPNAAADRLLEQLLGDARSQGFVGDEGGLRSQLSDKISAAQDYIDDLAATRDVHGNEALINAIKQIGGIRPFTEALGSGRKLRGDLASIVEGFASKSGRGEFGARSPFRNSGKEIDQVVDELHQFPAFRDMTEKDLLDRLFDISRRPADSDYQLPDLESILAGADNIRTGEPWWEGLTTNGSGESAASAEALSRQSGMNARGEQFVVYDRAGNRRPLLGPDAVDYVARQGETYGVEGPNGFRALDDRGGRVPQTADVLATGEVQNRLPGAGTVRDVEQPTPTFDMPFSLSGGVSNDFDREIQQLLGEEPESSIANIQTRHEIRDPEKVAALAESMRANGWQGRPVLVLDDNGTQTAWTATHRLEAAKQAGLTDVPMVHIDADALRAAGYDPAELTSKGKKARIQALLDAKLNDGGEAVRLLQAEQQGSPERLNPPPGAANVERTRIAPNVRDFLTKQLGYTPDEVDAMAPTEAYRIGRERTPHPERDTRLTRRPPTIPTRPEGESYDLERMQDLHDPLEQFLDMEVPRRQQQAAASTELRRRRFGVPASKVNQPGQRDVAPPITRRGVEASRDANRANDAALESEIADKVRRDNESPSERQSRVAKMQGAQKQAGRALDDAFGRGDYKGFADLVGKAVERYYKRTAKMGLGEDIPPRRGDSGTILEGGILPGFSMLGKVVNDPAKYGRLAAEMLRNPAIRGFVGAMAGYETGNTPEDALNNAILGFALAAAAPSGLRALRNAGHMLLTGHAPVPLTASKQDIAWWRLALGTPEHTVPELFAQAQQHLDELQRFYDTPARTEVKQQAEKLTKQGIAGMLNAAAGEAEKAGLKRKAYYARALARRVAGKETAGEAAVRTFTEPFFGKDENGRPNVDPRSLERHIKTFTYRTMIGYALDTAAQNLTQPYLALLHVSPRDLKAGYGAARTSAGKKLWESVKIKRPTDIPEDIVSETRELAGKETKQAPPGSLRDVAQRPGAALQASDNLNRGVVYLAALNRKGELQNALRTGKVDPAADSFARSVMRKTQGEGGPMGNNPFHKGPIAGSASIFTKYPAIFLQNWSDAFNDPNARGRSFVLATMGLYGLARLAGIDPADLLFGGGRPLGIDPFRPVDTLKRGPRAFPVGRGIMDVADHVTGEANHPIAAMPGNGFLDSDLAQLTLGRYPTKFIKKTGEVLGQGLGTHAPESTRDTRPPHTGIDDLVSLLGLKTSSSVAASDAARQASQFAHEARSQQRQHSSDAMEEMERAYQSGDANRIAAARARLTPQQRSAFDRRARQTPYERRRQQVPKNQRDEFDRRFKEDLDRR